MSLCCLYLFAELAVLDPHNAPLQYDRPAVVNPYATVGVGWEKEIGRFTLYGQAKHTSSAATRRDRGDNAASVGIRVYF